MAESLYKLFMRHLSLIDMCNSVSYKILLSAQDSKLESIVVHCENRTRLINVIDDLQAKIESLIEQLRSYQVLEVDDVVRLWAKDVDLWVQKTNRIDYLTTELLNKEKESTTKEIALLFKSIEKFKGYNLNTLKK